MNARFQQPIVIPSLRNQLIATAYSIRMPERVEKLDIRLSIDRANRSILQDRLASSQRAIRSIKKLRKLKK